MPTNPPLEKNIIARPRIRTTEKKNASCKRVVTRSQIFGKIITSALEIKKVGVLINLIILPKKNLPTTIYIKGVPSDESEEKNYPSHIPFQRVFCPDLLFPPPPSTHPLPKISRFSKSDLVPGSSLEKYMPGKEFLRAQWYLDRVRGKSIADWPNGIKIGNAVDETRLWYP